MTSRKVILEASAGLQPGQAAKDAAAALARDDFDAAATALLAGAARGEAPPEDLVRRALPGVDDPVLACALMGRTQGDAVALAVAALEGGALTTVQESHLLLAAALCLKGAPPPPRLVSQARRAARRKWPDEDAPVFAAAAQVLALPELFVLQPGLKEESASKDARLCRDDVQAWLDGPLEKVLPEEPLLGPPLPGAKKAEKVPRNAPCPCGSGKKFKVCHGGADAGPAPAESTLEGRLKAASPELSPRHVDSLRVGELVHLDLPALQTPALLRAYDRLCWARRLELAEQVVDELLARGAVEASRADDYRLDLVLYGLEQDRPDVVDRQRAKLKEPTLFDALSQLERDWLGQDLPASRLEAAARLALESKDEALTVDLAWLLMRRAPALGVLAARGAMARARPHESQELLTGAEDARDRVLLPPVEPAWAVHDAAFPREQGEDAEAQRAALETRAAELAKRLEESQKRLTDAEGRLHAAQTPGGAATDDAERGRLAQKVTELKELLKEGNRERAELRRNMQHLSEQLATQPASAPAPATAEDAEEEGDGLDAPRGALVPVFERAAAAALEALPKNVARDAVLEVGEVAAGLPHAWREVKRMQHVPGYLSVRVGIHYRVIFHVDGSALRVDEVIHRQDLDATVRRLGR